MPVHARSERTKAARCAGATAALAVMLPAGVASAQEPIAPAVPDGAAAIAAPLLQGASLPPSVAAPQGAVASRACPGAGRRSGRARRAAAVRCLVNRTRGGAGLRGFRASAALTRAARRHARDMAHRRYFAHQRAGGPSLARRARGAGFRGRRLGEAIAYGCGRSSTPASIVRSWLASPPHAAILLSRDLGKVGVAVAGRAPVACRGGATFVLDAGR